MILSGDNRFFLLRSKLGQISVVLISGFHDSIGIVENHGIIKGVTLDNYCGTISLTYLKEGQRISGQ